MLPGAVGKQPHGLAAADRIWVLAVGRDPHRRHTVDTLPVDAQRLAAGRQQRQVRAIAQQRVGQLGTRPDQVLTVVQHHQQAPPAHGLHNRLDHRTARLQAHPQHIRHRHRDQVRVTERRKIGEPHPIPRLVQQPGRHLQPQPGLARPARTGQRHQPRLTHQTVHRGQLHLPADETRHLCRQVTHQARTIRHAWSGPPGSVAHDRPAPPRSTPPPAAAPARPNPRHRRTRKLASAWPPAQAPHRDGRQLHRHESHRSLNRAAKTSYVRRWEGTRYRNAANQRTTGRYATRRARSGKTGAAIPSPPWPGTRAVGGLVKVASAAHAT